MEWNEIVTYAWWTFAFRWLHVISGVMWIGLLWYFNFTQIADHAQNSGRIEAGRYQVHPPEACSGSAGARWAPSSTGLILAAQSMGELLVSAGRGRHRRLITPQIRCDRHRHVAGHHHVVQCLVHHLAQPEKEHRHRRGHAGKETKGRAHRRTRPRASTPCSRSPCSTAWRRCISTKQRSAFFMKKGGLRFRPFACARCNHRNEAMFPTKLICSEEKISASPIWMASMRRGSTRTASHSCRCP